MWVYVNMSEASLAEFLILYLGF
ncbi:hypothetical protein MPNT_410014 [Candidatus Methylacidithermus pantelleriae]|uniref:Uncharacterized protein n=1 Tax=Candidatus Methylacidithermus pantelleriae TaxID=2744239 RepID=A0A8J2BV91_9BACT|nr:hypothetical protein MPNT_410014 [Candidatus Methylacidithermus pantelleriae]